ncbi:hypothetical protein V8D89_001052 [Ganoderma adspersum]
MLSHSRRAPIVFCPDILVEIFNYLQPGRRSPEDYTLTSRNRRVCQQALLACSLTCRTLSGLALDLLWRVMDDIQPLLRLLHGDRRKRSMIVLKSPITPEAWTNLQSYAIRIREIGHSSRLDRVHSSVWTFLAIKCSGLPLLPRLYTLEAVEISLDDLASLFLLLSPSLSSLRLSFKQGSWSSPPRVALLTLQNIKEVAPCISSFRMSGCRHLTIQQVSVLQNFPGLKDLSLGPGCHLDGPALLQLSTSSLLDALAVSIRHINSADLQNVDNGFRSLRKLIIRGALQDLVEFILSSHLPLLDELTLQVIDSRSVTQGHLCRSLESVCEHPGLPGSLKRISCEFSSGVARANHDGTRALVRFLKPLLAFPLIEHCCFTFYCTPPSVCDEDLALLGDTWDKLQSLEVRQVRHHVHGRLSPTDMQRPTLAGLTELARRCPGLVRVHLPELDASTLPQTSTIYGLRYAIREISFDHVRYTGTFAKRPCAVAAALDIVFPMLDVASSMSAAVSLSPSAADSRFRTSRASGVRPTHSEWWTVMKFVRAMQVGRRHRDLAENDVGPGAASGDAGGLEASMVGAANLDWDLDLDLGSEDWEPDSEQDVGSVREGMELGLEVDSDLDSTTDLAGAIFGHYDSDVRIRSLMRHIVNKRILTVSYLAQQQ